MRRLLAASFCFKSICVYISSNGNRHYCNGDYVSKGNLFFKNMQIYFTSPQAAPHFLHDVYVETCRMVAVW